MITASSAFISKVNSDSRTFRARFLIGGSALSCDVGHITVYKGAGQEIAPGTVYVPYFEAEITNCETVLYGREVVLQIGLVLGDSEEYLTIGTFSITKEKKALERTNLTGVGRLNSKCNGIVNIAARTTITSAISTIQSETGCTVTLKGIAASGSIANAVKATARDALSEIAKLLGGFVTEDNSGGIVIAKYGSGSALSVDGDRMTSLPEANSAAYSVTGLKVIVSEAGTDEEGDEIPEVAFTNGTPNVIYQTPNMTQTLFNLVVPRIVGYTFRPAVVELALGDPRLEPWDWLAVTDPAGNDYTVPCLQLAFEFDGGLQTRVDAAVTTDEEAETTVKGPIAQAMEQYAAELVTANDAILKRATIGQLEAESARINDLEADHVSTTDLSAATARIGSLETANTNITGRLTAAEGNIHTLDVQKATVADLNAATGRIGTLETNTANITGRLTTAEADIDSLEADTASLGTVVAGKADINFLNVDVETVTQSWIQDLFVQGGFISNSGTAFNLVGVHISGDLIDANTIKADRLLLQGANGLYYAINVNELGEPTASSDPKYQTGIDGKAIIAHSITATEITTQNIQGAGGWINFASGTFAYVNVNSGHGIVWDGSQLTISTDRLTLGSLDLSDAIGRALDAAEIAEGTLIYDHDYTIDRTLGRATFTAYLYRGGVDVKTEFSANEFTWYYKNEDNDDFLNEKRYIGSGYTCTVNLSDMQYGSHIIGCFTPTANSRLLTENDETLTNRNNQEYTARTASGDSVRVSDLAVMTTLYATDKIMIAGPSDEHLVTVQTLQDYLNLNLDKQVLFNTTSGWNSQTTLVSAANTLYVYTDYETSSGQNVAGIKVGDGNAYVVDLPFTDAVQKEHINNTTVHITNTERDFWNNKVRCYYAGTENLIFTTA